MLLTVQVARNYRVPPPELPPAADAGWARSQTGATEPVAASESAESLAAAAAAGARADLPYDEACCPLCGPQRDLRLEQPPLTGSDVAELQERLSRLGYYQGSIDWIYDEQVVSAVRAFQRATGLDEDGIVDDAVWSALDDEHDTAFVTLGKPSGKPLIVIDIDKRRLRLYFDQNLFATFAVAVGKPDTPTPIGEWHIVDKDRNWGTGFGSRFMRLDVPWGVYGIHGTNKPWSIGQPMSGGCIRMHDSQVRKLFDLVEVGTPVRITGTLEVRRLCKGDRGSDVMEAQAALAEAGYFQSKIDGFFGNDTEQAVLRFQRENGLVPNGQIDRATYNALGL